MPYAGLFRDFVEIYSYVKEPNEYGEMIDVRHRKTEAWCKVSHLGGSRQVLNSEVQFPYSKNFMFRAHVPLDENDEIKWKNKFYRIMSIDKDETVDEQIVICEVINE